MARKLPTFDLNNKNIDPMNNVVVYSGDTLTGAYSVTFVPTSITNITGNNTWKHWQLNINAIEAGLMVGMFVSYGVVPLVFGVIMAINGNYILTYEYTGGSTSTPAGTSYTAYMEPSTSSTKPLRYTGSWTAPAGITRAKVTVIGGGGGGGAYSSNTGAQGGQAGGQVIKMFTNIVPGTTYNFVVGAGGVGGDTARRFLPYSYLLSGTGSSPPTSYPTNNTSSTSAYLTHLFSTISAGIGGPGGNSFFDGPSKLIAIGGIGGMGVRDSSNYSTGGWSASQNLIGGGAFGGDINLQGALGNAGAGVGNANSILGVGGQGGSTIWGQGGMQNAQSNGYQQAGITGTGYGTGGGPGAGGGNASAQAVYGANGRTGAIIIEY